MSEINKTQASNLSAEVLQMIEEKRRQAVERRKQMQANREGFCVPLGSDLHGTMAPSTSGRTNVSMTNIKPKEAQLPAKKLKNDLPLKTTQITGSTRLLSPKRFELTIGYNEQVVAVLRKLISKDFNPTNKRWSFDLNEYKKMISDLRSIAGIDITFTDSIPERLINALLEARNRPKEPINLIERLGPKFMSTLYSFQTEGIVFGIRAGGRCMIADDMGLGKTIQSIGIAQWFRQDWPLLIVCPSSLRLQWRDSIVEYLSDVSLNDILIVKKINETLPKIAITIISYDLMARMRSQFSLESKQIYNCVILDESHYIKTDSAARTEAVHLLAKSSKRVILLTGTPALSRPMELFTQIKLIDPKLFASKHEFGLRYCDAQLKSFWQRGGHKRSQIKIWDYKGAKNLDELKIFLEATLLVRRLKTEVLQELTKKKREMVSCSLNLQVTIDGHSIDR